jgi:hypothetical protein
MNYFCLRTLVALFFIICFIDLIEADRFLEGRYKRPLLPSILVTLCLMLVAGFLAAAYGELVDATAARGAS